MLKLGRVDRRRLVVLSAISLLFLSAISLPQLNASPAKGEAGSIDYSNLIEDNNSTAVAAEQITNLSLPTSIATNDGVDQEGVYRTFTTDDYSLAEINSALASCPTGQVVKLAAGTYTLDGILNVPAGKTLSGSMDASGKIATVLSTSLTGEALRVSGYINIGSGGNTVREIKTLNGYYFHGTNSHDFLFQDCEYNGPTDSTAGQSSINGFFIYIGVPGVYDNGQFVRCVANNAPAFGFLVAADGSKNSNRLGPNAYSAHNWAWTGCQAQGCGISNMKYPSHFVYGCGFDFFEGFGPADDVVGMRVTNSAANNNAADGFHVEYMMDITDLVFDACTADGNGQWFKTGNSANPFDGVLIGTGFYLGGQVTSQSKVINSKAENNWGYSTHGGGAGIIDSERQTDKTGAYSQGNGAAKTVSVDKPAVDKNATKESASKQTSTQGSSTKDSNKTKH